MPQRKIDTRLTHLLKLHREARRDVESYVLRKWPIGKNLSYEHQKKHCVGVVVGHDPGSWRVVVQEKDTRRKMRVPYSRIKDRRAKMT